MKNLGLLLLFISCSLMAQDPGSKLNSSTFKGLEFRNIGPAFASGRIADIDIHPQDDNCWYVAVGSGGVWKTVNAGVTWKPVFDDQGSYSIGCVTIDPLNPNRVWVGTGENIGGRHVAYGDGIYLSEDGGKSWKNMGLKESEHISKIIVHPENPEVVYVAAQGPLWNKGGDRGLYKTTDGGSSWEKVLGVNEWTGVTDIVIDPSDPERLYAATWQRHRNVAAYMGGGSGSGIYRSDDGGKNWKKLTSGIPGSNLGKIGLAISPFNNDVIYAAIELDRRTGGIFMSENRGESWTKQSDAVSGATGPHYYQELYASPHYEGRLYLVDNNIQVSNDHGKTFYGMKEVRKHGDSHSINFRKDDPDYLLVGTDGGVYESFDNTENWRFMGNLPITQYYKLAVDDSEPFYFIYGGTQDNGSHGGPSRTDTEEGIRNADWFSILGADGHQTATEPGNPGIVYAESQQGHIHRIDRITGEQVFIQPQAREGDPHERFNWDTPILVSPHKPARIYTASYRVWRSDNRGNSWEPISPDLTRNQERLELPIMGRKQSWDNPWDISAMSTYNTITSLAESPIKEGLLYAGTDDGIIQVSENGGETWRKIEVSSIKGVPATAFVNDIRADLFDANTVYAALDNHKFGDFKPYLIKSTDAGESWSSISGNIPDRTLIWRIVQDHKRKDLLFAATEFGIYFTIDGGNEWIALEGGLPTISFRDIKIQRRENDLVAASFGRGFYILDDICPLRSVSREMLDKDAMLFPVKDPWFFRPKEVTIAPGANDYRAPNPPFGAVFTYYLKDDINSLKELRVEKEKKLDKNKADIPFPGWDALEKEKEEDKPFILFTVKDTEGKIINHVMADAKKGFHRVNWELNHYAAEPVDVEDESEMEVNTDGFMVTPGEYAVSMYAVSRGEVKQLSEEQGFTVKPLYENVLEPVPDDEVKQFRADLEEFIYELGKVSKKMDEARKRVEALKNASFRNRRQAGELLEKVYEVDSALLELEIKYNGYSTKGEVGEKQSPTPRMRLGVAYRGLSTSYGPTSMHRQSLEIGIKELMPIKQELESISGSLENLEEEFVEAGAQLIRQ
ncbi:MAG: glycosyl hydrolase [Bacteroidota bacterium]|nr:glycosyl hydrolase [Bacteroidota bacterium]